ncbi:uncharacterized protein LOC141641605 [Silene latifolia]|uniref:uncharacterized protein LOC141641605 n=1 Tax=Silene latifolia TaxID=37657 RepID=UPI003D771446
MVSNEPQFPPLPKNAKRKMIHLSEFQNSELSNSEAAGNSNSNALQVMSQPGIVPVSTSLSFRDKVQRYQTVHSDLVDAINEDYDIDIESDEDSNEDGEDSSSCPKILLSKEEKIQLRKPWRHALIIKLFDKKIGYLSLIRKLNAKWAIKGKLTLIDISDSYYVARFSCLQDYEHVITQGPWMVDDHYITIRKWVPNFVPSEDTIKYITAWVRIPNLPVEYFNEGFLRKIGSKIGKVIRIDKNTALAERGQFTRMSVEVNIDEPLLSKFWLNGKIYRIQYEGLKSICFKCGKIGHAAENCTGHLDDSNSMENDDKGSDVSSASASPIITVPEIAEKFGDWMMVKKPPRRRAPPKADKPDSELPQIVMIPSSRRFKLSPLRGMVAPILGVMIGESPSMDLKFEPVQKDPTSLLVEMSIPWSINDVLSLVSRAYLSTLPYLPVIMSDRIPNLMPNVPPITCMVWNVQGTRNKNKIAALKEVVKTYRPTILALVETHMSGDHAENIRKIIGYEGHSRIDAVGFSGGIWVYWKTDIVNVVPVYEHSQFITLEVSRTGGVPWLFSAVYASPDPTNRHALWSELESFAHVNNLPWVLAGDFNETRSLDERHGGDSNMARRCDKFNNWIENCELIELEFSGPAHT